MPGLLYKDYVSVKGKIITIIILSAYAVLAVFQLTRPLWYQLFGGDTVSADMIVDGLYLTSGLVVFFTAQELFFIAPAKMAEDDKSHARVFDYINSLPVTKEKYIASHYIFIGIAAYVLLSVTIIWSVIGTALNRTERLLDTYTMSQTIVLPVICFSLTLTAIDLTGYICLGTEKGKNVRIALVMAVIGVILWIFLFGNVREISMEQIIDWITDHTFELALVNCISPVVTLLIYYLSYRISCRFCYRGDN